MFEEILDGRKALKPKGLFNNKDYLTMKTLKLKKDIIEKLSNNDAKNLKGGTLFSDMPTACLSMIASCLASCKGETCNIAPCKPGPEPEPIPHPTDRVPCKDISGIDPDYTIIGNCLVTRQTCAC